MATTSEAAPIYAKAKHRFTGKNNDELCFNKGDIIAITQKLDEGWWEGTVGDKTGWFPSNYVEQIAEHERLIRHRTRSPAASQSAQLTAADSPEKYRRTILTSLIQLEKSHLNELKATESEYFEKLRNDGRLSNLEFSALHANYSDVNCCQATLVDELNKTLQQPASNQKVGGIYLDQASVMQSALVEYCHNHPIAIEVLDKRKQVICNLIDSSEKYKKFVSGLSAPFRHLSKRVQTLKELELNTDDTHADRGDTQRAHLLFREIMTGCEDARKQRELQVELRSAGKIQQWPNDLAPIAELGEIQYMGNVCLSHASIGNDKVPMVNGHSSDSLTSDRCLIVFIDFLLLLRLTDEPNTYIFDKMIYLDQPTVLSKYIRKSDDDDSYILLTLSRNNGGINLISILFSVYDGAMTWMSALQKCNNITLDISQPTIGIEMENFNSIKNEAHKLHRIQIVDLPKATTSSLGSSSALHVNHDLQMLVPFDVSASRDDVTSVTLKGMFSGYCLRPSAAVLSEHHKQHKTPDFKMRKGQASHDPEDALLLRTLESYSAGMTINKSMRTDANVLVPEDEKLFVEEYIDNELVMQEKSLVDTVYTMREHVNKLQQKVRLLEESLKFEQQRRADEQIK